jgi:hypothetical protein
MCSTSPQFRFYDERMDDDLLNSVGFSYINDNFDLVSIVWLFHDVHGFQRPNTSFLLKLKKMKLKKLLLNKCQINYYSDISILN